MPVLFAVTLFMSAGLLFMVQPMIGRMILPLLGGSPAAWNTCMVFFQIVLLLGYFYAHKLTEKLPPRRQVLLHLGVLIGAIVTFGIAVLLSDRHSPIAIVKSLAPQSSSYPMFGVLALLFVAIGIPFFAVSTSAPLLQRWFAYSGHPSARDPYFLYAASNAGSLLSLLAYPIILEPSLTINGQAWLFAGGFLVLFATIYACGSFVPTITAKPSSKKLAENPIPQSIVGDAPGWGRTLKWVALAFVPSSLMLGVTFHMTTDIASIPLLWVGPLALYLLTFIIAFAHTPNWFRPLLGNVSPVITLLLVFVLTSQQSIPNVFYSLGLHLLAYFFAALMCHSELARDRPPPAYLTSFYLWISVGGMLGGIFNALFAPVVFDLAYEYPIAIAIGCMLIPKLTDPGSNEADDKQAMRRMMDFVVPIGMLALMAMLTLLPGVRWFDELCDWIAKNVSAGFQFCRLPLLLEYTSIRLMIVYALPCMLCFFFIERPIRFGLCVAAILFVGYWRQNEASIERTERSFFGILKVENYGRFRRLVHGTTLHGTQATDSRITVWDQVMPLGVGNGWDALLIRGALEKWNFREEPLTYYHRTGPVGHMFVNLRDKTPTAPVAMVGLGTGSVSCYAQPGQSLTFYEIDPTVENLVANSDQYFSYYQDAVRRGANMKIVLGDARLKLEETSDKYELLLVDAFSSDSIPVHLLTKEAVELYLNRLTENGILALHISNKFVSLDYVVAKIAEELGVKALVFNDSWTDNGERGQHSPPGKTQSSWVVISRKPELLAPFQTERFTTSYNYRYVKDDPPVNQWHPLEIDPNVKLWTDDYADVLSVMMIKEIQRIRHFLGLPTVEALRK